MHEVTLYVGHMIATFRNKALAAYWQKGDASKLLVASVDRIGEVLQVLSAAAVPEDLSLPGYRFHRLSGRNAGRFSVRIIANWRLTFAWEPPNAIRVDFEDYH